MYTTLYWVVGSLFVTSVLLYSFYANLLARDLREGVIAVHPLAK
jgi:hypothetical protein